MWSSLCELIVYSPRQKTPDLSEIWTAFTDCQIADKQDSYWRESGFWRWHNIGTLDDNRIHVHFTITFNVRTRNSMRLASFFAAWLTVLYAHKQAYRRYTAHRRNATFASDMHLTLLLSYSIFSLTVKTKCTNYRPNIHALTFCLIIGLLWHDVNGLRHYIENIRQ